jgi:serine protease
VRSLTRFLVAAAVISTATPCRAAPLRPGLTQRYLDGGVPQRVRRSGGRGSDGRAELTLFHPRTGAAIRASVGDEALVQLQPGTPASSLADAGLTIVRTISPQLGIVQVRGQADEDGLDVAERLTRKPHAAIAQVIPDLALPHWRSGTSFTPPPNDPSFPDQWFWDQLDMKGAWARQTGSSGVTVVVVDDGCDLAHPDLVDKLDPGTDVFSGDSDPSYLPMTPDNNHGTSCAGLVGASTNNGKGVAGACPDCRLRCVRLLGKDGDLIPVGADLAAFQFAIDTNAQVVSNSWGFKSQVAVPDMIRQIIEMLYDSGNHGLGAVVVFAAGNDDRLLGDDEINGVRGVVTVGATNNFGELTAYSNFGPSVDVVAPTGTLTTDVSGADGADPGDYVDTFSGTSSACPVVAGVFGLMASASPTSTAAQLEGVMTASAHQSPFATPDPTGHDDYYGMGAVRPVDALRLLGGEVLDGGVVDAAADGGITKNEGGCGCTVGRRAPSFFSWSWILLVALLTLRGWRSPSRPR